PGLPRPHLDADGPPRPSGRRPPPDSLAASGQLSGAVLVRQGLTAVRRRAGNEGGRGGAGCSPGFSAFESRLLARARRPGQVAAFQPEQALSSAPASSREGSSAARPLFYACRSSGLKIGCPHAHDRAAARLGVGWLLRPGAVDAPAQRRNASVVSQKDFAW